MEVPDSLEGDGIMTTGKRKYPQELKERAVRLVLDARDEQGGRRGVCTRVGHQLGIPSDTLRGWVQRAEIDAGDRPGVATDDQTRPRRSSVRIVSFDERTRS